MKKLSIAFIALVCVLLTACKSEQKSKPDNNPNLIEPEMRLSAEDTVGVRRLTKQFLNCLETKDLEGAVAMLNRFEHDSIKPLTNEMAAKQRFVLGMFLGMPKYEIDHIIFHKETDSEVKYTVTMFERTDENDKRPNQASFLIRPIRRSGKWYLTLADTQTERRKSEIKH